MGRSGSSSGATPVKSAPTTASTGAHWAKARLLFGGETAGQVRELAGHLGQHGKEVGGLQENVANAWLQLLHGQGRAHLQILG